MLTLILGGARSGKSRLAQRLAMESLVISAAQTPIEADAKAPRVSYIATYRSENDPEMTERIRRHRAHRPTSWPTIEEPLVLAEAIERAAPDSDVVIVDCLTVWLSNLLWEHRGDALDTVEQSASTELVRIAAAAVGCRAILVSNEVGSGVIPEHPVARMFRDLQGLINQWAAEAADEVILVVAGLPLYLKNIPSVERRS